MRYAEALSAMAPDPYVQRFVWSGQREPGRPFMDIVIMNVETGVLAWMCAAENTIMWEINRMVDRVPGYQSGRGLPEDEPMALRDIWHAGVADALRQWVHAQFEK